MRGFGVLGWKRGRGLGWDMTLLCCGEVEKVVDWGCM